MKRTTSNEFGVAAGTLILSVCAAAIMAGASAHEDAAWPDPTFYTVVVRPGDTLASIADRYHVRVTSIAGMNRMGTHPRVSPGEVLRIPAESAATREAVLDEALDRTVPNYAPPPKSFGNSGSDFGHQAVAARETLKRFDAPATSDASSLPRRFAWPIQGPVISAFGPASDGERNDGINIAAMLGTPIHAAASGTVTYAGDELKGYGNLILIAHAEGYITAYAHAQSINVGRGDHVEKGEIIGTAGDTGGVDRPQLHFEIREGVKALNPVRLLAALP
jgi:murein DD-endopeptidase MepM/ murein hydrolase activator NlpD